MKSSIKYEYISDIFEILNKKFRLMIFWIVSKKKRREEIKVNALITYTKWKTHHLKKSFKK